MPLAAGPRAEWTELGEQLIARGIYSFKQRQKYIYRANKSHNRANKSHNILKYKTHINTKIQIHLGVRVTNHVSCMFGQIKRKYEDIEIKQNKYKYKRKHINKYR